MDHYKAQTTLNEKDSLQDLLILEKAIVKIYATAICEGCSNGFRNTVMKNLQENVSAQMDVFLLMTELGYYKVESAPIETLNEQKAKFSEEYNCL